MTKVQSILKDINNLNINELELILQEILKKVDQEKRIRSILNEYKGIGKGIWTIDAQKYINQDRDQDRIYSGFNLIKRIMKIIESYKS